MKKQEKADGEKKRPRSWLLTLLVYLVLALLFTPFVISRYFPWLIDDIEAKIAPHVPSEILRTVKTALAKTSSGVDKPAPPVPVPGQHSTEKKILLPCRLIQVFDGDTIKVEIDNEFASVRFLRINTPETNMYGYREATDTLRARLAGKQIAIEYEEPGVPATDDYGRLLAYVYAGGENVNIEMVRSGWTSFWTLFGEGKYAAEFLAAQQEAERAGRGLWGAYETTGPEAAGQDMSVESAPAVTD